jgi:phosphoenolpyruvate carboxylase
VREACRSEVELVKQSLREACEAEVRLVRDACLSEVQRVKCDLAEACQVEVAALVSSMQHDVAVARTEQRKQLEVAAEPYVRAVQSVHARTAQALEALQSRAGDESRRVHPRACMQVLTTAPSPLSPQVTNRGGCVHSRQRWSPLRAACSR